MNMCSTVKYVLIQVFCVLYEYIIRFKKACQNSGGVHILNSFDFTEMSIVY